MQKIKKRNSYLICLTSYIRNYYILQAKLYTNQIQEYLMFKVTLCKYGNTFNQ